MGIGRGRDPTGSGVNNPLSRGAGCEQHLSGSVRTGAGNRPGYSMVCLRPSQVSG